MRREVGTCGQTNAVVAVAVVGSAAGAAIAAVALDSVLVVVTPE